MRQPRHTPCWLVTALLLHNQLTGSLVNGNTSIAAHAQSADKSYCYTHTVSNEFSTSNTDIANHNALSPVRVRAGAGTGGRDRRGCEEGEVKIKRMIEKEYVHVQDVSYLETLKKKKRPLVKSNWRQ